MKHLLSLLLLLCAFGAEAATRYACNCDTGAHASCVAGSDSNDGLTTSTPKQTFPSESNLNNAAAGDEFLQCQGGRWASVSGRLIDNMTGAPRGSSPIVIGTYAPPTGATGRPVVVSSNNGAVITFGEFNGTTSDCGWTLRGMHFRGPADNSGERTIDVHGVTCDVLLDDMQLENAYVGIRFNVTANQTTCQRFRITNSVLSRNFGNGIIGSCSDLTLEDSTIEENNPDGSPGEHGVYIAGRGLESRLVIRRNIFRNNSLNAGVCGSGNITVRGKKDQLLIEDNLIEVPSSSNTCYCISVIEGYPDFPDERYDRAVIRRNTCVNTHQGIQVTITPGGLIENNRVFSDVAANNINGIAVGTPDPDDDDGTPNNMTVRHNTVALLNATGSGSACYGFNVGTGHNFYNNACVLGAAASIRCFNHTALSNYTVWNYNWCWNQGSGVWSGSYSNLAAAQAAGFDTNGGSSSVQFVSTPTFASPGMAIQSSSPLRNAGRTPSSPTEPLIYFDALYCKRDSQLDIGAEEYGATPCLTPRGPVGRP